jgi:Xaa-Pro dipeptidase
LEKPGEDASPPPGNLYNDFSLLGGAFMFSRRSFLQSSSLAAGISVALPTLSHAAECDNSLPPAIAALQSLRAEAKPITVEERAARQEKARRLMSDNSLSAILLAQGTSLAYFTGVRWEGGERLFAMVLPAKGEAFYVSPAFEEDRAREQLAKAPDGSHPDLRVWQEDESPTPAWPRD